MSAQDNIEKVLRKLHISLSKSPAYQKEPSKVIVDKQEMLDLLSELNKCVYDIMDQYELTRQSRDRAERQFHKRGDEIVLDASRKAEDIYAASVMYTSEALSRVYNIMMDTSGEVEKLYQSMQERFSEQQRMVRTNQLELKSQLQNLTDTEKYLKIISDRNKQIEKEHNEGKDMPEPITNIYADRRSEIKVNTEYLEMMGMSTGEEVVEGVSEVKKAVGSVPEGDDAGVMPIQENSDIEAQIKVDLDADYFKWKEAQQKGQQEQNNTKEEKSKSEGFVSMIKNIMK